jgi:hypothetical protein
MVPSRLQSVFPFVPQRLVLSVLQELAKQELVEQEPSVQQLVEQELVQQEYDLSSVFLLVFGLA